MAWDRPPSWILGYVFRVYVDEAGSRGVSPKSDRHFVLSGVIVHEHWNDQVREQLCDLKKKLGRHPDHVLHFKRLKPQRRIAAAAGIANLGVARVVSVIISKSHLQQDLLTGKTPYIVKADPMYLWALRLLVERVSWYARDTQRQSVIMTFSHVAHLDPLKLYAYRTKLESLPPDRDVRIEWGLFEGYTFRVESPAAVDLLQIADVVASSTYQAVEPRRDGPRYIEAFRSKIYRRPSGPVTTYGLKVFPTRVGSEHGSLGWLRDY